MRKKITKIFLLTVSVIALYMLCSFSVSALPGYTLASSNSSSTVYCMPDNTSSMTIGSIGVETVKVYWAEGNSYYIEYTVSNGSYSGYKRGYVPKSKINVSGIGGINYSAVTANTTSNQTVYNRSITSSLNIGTVFLTDSITVLQEDGTWYYIQYPVSSGYKRGYVPKSVVPSPQPYASPTGWLDSVSSTTISGWAWRSDIPNTPIAVHIYIKNLSTNQEWGYAVTANNYRSDLASLGYGNGYHGYSYSVNWSNYPNGNYSVIAYGIGVNGDNPALMGTPAYHTNSGTTQLSDRDYYSNPITNSSSYRSCGYSTDHTGIDIAAPSGTSIYSANEGTAHYYYVTGIYQGSRRTISYGNYVTVTNNRMMTLYAHMSSFANNYSVSPYPSADISYNQATSVVTTSVTTTTVTKGSLIGYVGSVGNSGGNHLHFEFKIDGIRKNPDCYVNTVGSVQCSCGPHYTHLGIY